MTSGGQWCERRVITTVGLSILFLSELLRKKDEQIMSLLEEKVKVFRDMCEGGSGLAEETSPAQSIRTKMLFRATPDYITKGEPIMKEALREGESRVDSRGPRDHTHNTGDPLSNQW